MNSTQNFEALLLFERATVEWAEARKKAKRLSAYLFQAFDEEQVG